LVERGQVLETLSGMLAEVANGDGRLVFLGGEAGIGKTSVAAALLASVPAPFVVRRGACDNLTTPAALGPIAEALPEIGTDLAVDRAAALRDRQTNGLPVPRGPRAGGTHGG
jgi:predicted ATPase